VSAFFDTVGATPSHEQLPADVLAQLRQLLMQDLRSRASEHGRSVAKATAPTGAAVGHFEVAWQLAENVVVRSQDAVDDIEAALARLDEGTYGVCEQCAATIPPERLVDIPGARLCASCQGRRDAMR
jgi:RNA polymerase-binding transcription factor DksA